MQTVESDRISAIIDIFIEFISHAVMRVRTSLSCLDRFNFSSLREWVSQI
jgi:hypothetical protein